MTSKEIKEHWMFFVALGFGSVIVCGCGYNGMSFQSELDSKQSKTITVTQPREISSEEMKVDVSVLPEDIRSTLVSTFDNVVLLVGSGQAYFSHNGGREWQSKRGVVGIETVTKDGGRSYENTGDVGIQRLCNIQSSATTKSGRTFVVVTCEHTVQIWSVLLTDLDRSWFVTNFTYRDDPSEGMFTPRPQIRKFGDTVLVAAYLPDGSGLLTSDDDGKSWYPFWICPGKERWIVDFDVLDDSRVVVLDNFGNLLRINPSGATTTLVSDFEREIAKNLRGIRFKNSQEGYVFGESGVVYRTEDGGKNWMRIELPPTGTKFYKAVFSRDGKEVWFTGDSDEVVVLDSALNITASRKLGKPRYIYFRLTESEQGPILIDENRLMRLSLR